MPYRNDKNLGETIQGIVEDAIGSSQFGSLNDSIQETIDAIFDEFGFQGSDPKRRQYRSAGGREAGRRPSYGAGAWATGARTGNSAPGAEAWSSSGRTPYNAGGQYAGSFRKQAPPPPREEKPKLFVQTPAGAFTGPIWMAVGGFFSFIFGISTIAVFANIIADTPGIGNIMGMVVLLALLAPSVLLFRYGFKQRTLIKRFRQYVRTLAGRNYCSIKELAADSGQTEDQVLSDLREMFDKKYFPQGHVDLQRTTLMLDDETFKQSLETQKAYEERAAREREENAGTEKSIFDTGMENAELQAAVEEGERYIRKIREANAVIPGEEISRKLRRLEELMDKIFAVLSQKPDELPKLRKFMNYYMPTTDKLVQTYRELDAQPVEGENISKAKREIEETLDTINNAYEKLLDNFYAEAAMDVSSDISVLQNLMAQEGLVEQPFGSIK